MPSVTTRRVGDLLTRYREKISQGYRLRLDSTRGNQRRYVMECVDPSQSPEPPRSPEPPQNPDPFTSATTPPPRPTPAPRAELPVIDDFHWSSCADARPCVVDPRLVEQGGEHAQLVKRCEFLRGETCAKQKIPCDYEQSDSGITQALADALKTTHEDAVPVRVGRSSSQIRRRARG